MNCRLRILSPSFLVRVSLSLFLRKRRGRTSSQPAGTRRWTTSKHTGRLFQHLGLGGRSWLQVLLGTMSHACAGPKIITHYSGSIKMKKWMDTCRLQVIGVWRRADNSLLKPRLVFLEAGKKIKVKECHPELCTKSIFHTKCYCKQMRLVFMHDCWESANIGRI